MARPVVSELTELLYDTLAPAMTVQDESLDWPLLRYCAVLVEPLEKAFEVAHGEDVPWGSILDPDTCPDWALPWLARWVGVVTEEAWDAEEIREAIKIPSGFARGRVESLRNAPKPYLTGSKTVILIEREPSASAYRLYMRTLLTETPDSTAVLNAILRQKPAGIVLDYNTLTQTEYLQIESAYASYAAARTANPTYQDLKTQPT